MKIDKYAKVGTDTRGRLLTHRSGHTLEDSYSHTGRDTH